MLLTKTKPDKWVSARQVISSFSFPVTRKVEKYTLQSEPFGLGWTAQCAVQIQVIAGGKKSSNRLQATCVLYALPSSTSAPPGNVSFRTSVESKPHQQKTIQAPTKKKAFLGTFILAESEFLKKSRLTISITISFSKDAAPPVTIPKVIPPMAPPPEVVIPDVVPPEVTLPDVLPEVPEHDVDPSETTLPDVIPPEEPLPHVVRPDLTSSYWSRVLKAMKSSLDNDGKLPVDLKFMVHTCVSPRGRIGHPRAIFASSVLLEGYTPYLDKYINTGATLVDLDSDVQQDTGWDAYDYDADSDFDEDDGDEIDPDTEDLDAAMSATTDFNSEVFEPDASDPPPLATPTDWESMITPGSPSQVLSLPVDTALGTGGSVSESSAGPSAFSQRDDSHGTDVQRAVRLGTIWHIKDTAYTTWKAFLAYMYTQEITFAPLKSSGTLRTAAGKDACSAKSMYRLAMKAGLDSLKDLAFENIRSQLTPSNIVEEVFSKFTYRYPELLDIEVRYLVANFTDPLVYPQWEKKMEEVGRGICPQGASVVNRVMGLTLLERK